MRSLILQTISRAVLPVAMVFAIYLLLRGHDEPGGGFVAGLVTSSGIVLQALAFGIEETRRVLSPKVRLLIPLGLLLAAGTGLLSMAAGDPYLTHYHAELGFPRRGYVHLGTTLLFDVGVYLVVVGVSASLLSEFARDP